MLDKFDRPISYVRISVTDRCNLRCFYCMPEEGITYLAKESLLSYEELERLIRILALKGVSKVRITGGEPFVRKDLIPFLRRVKAIPGVEELHITTNGVLTGKYIPDLIDLGIRSVNLSLDTLDKNRFYTITRRDVFEEVWSCLQALTEAGIRTKVNAVVMEGKNTEDLIPLAELTRDKQIDVRFIEEMPFNGQGARAGTLTWDHVRILSELVAYYPNLEKLPDEPHLTAHRYKVPAYQGNIGIIAAFSRTFCGTCNRIRVTAQGILKTCLYDHGALDLKTILRNNYSDKYISDKIIQSVWNRPLNGFEAESQREFNEPVSESMSTIGG